MADPRLRHPASVPGPWFVDTTCIDCDACRQLAPAVFAESDGHGPATVWRQPASAEDERAASRALVACPTAALPAGGRALDRAGLLPPRDPGPGVYYRFNPDDH